MQKIFFHGTNKKYYERQLRLFGRYQHDLIIPVQLTENPEIARINANKRSLKYESEPVVMIICTPRLTDQVRRVPKFGTAWGCSYIDEGSYLTIDTANDTLRDLPTNLLEVIEGLLKKENQKHVTKKQLRNISYFL